MPYPPAGSNPERALADLYKDNPLVPEPHSLTSQSTNSPDGAKGDVPGGRQTVPPFKGLLPAPRPAENPGPM